MADKDKRDLIVIGGGPGGYTAAFKAADLGLNVTLIDPEENPGGVCLYRGCIPTKALLHVVKTGREVRRASAWGLETGEVRFNLDKVRDYKDQVVEKLTGGVGQLLKKRKIEHIRGRALFVDSSTLEIEESGSGKEKGKEKKRRLEFDAAIIATGARARPLPGHEDFESRRILTAEKALELEEIPEKLLVVGAGYIGLELATVYSELGAEVSIAEITDQLMPGADPDLVAEFSKVNKPLFGEIYLNTAIDSLEETDGGIQASLKRKGNSAETLEFDRILVTVGRLPNTDSLGLEAAGVETDEKGFVVVDGERRTSAARIFAIGDVTGAPLLAHKAAHEGIVAAEVIAGKKSAFDPRAIPAVEYCDPEIAWCGLSAAEAREAGYEVSETSFPWAASGRAATMDRSDGLTKLIIDDESERVLGVGIVGKDAGELIPEAALAIEMGAVAEDLAKTIHPHPTLSETVMEAAEAYYGSAIHVYKPRKK